MLQKGYAGCTRFDVIMLVLQLTTWLSRRETHTMVLPGDGCGGRSLYTGAGVSASLGSGDGST